MRRPLFVSFIFFLGGICLSRYAGGSFFVILLFLLLFPVFMIAGKRQQIPLTWGIFLLVLLLSYGYGCIRFAEDEPLPVENGIFYVVEGRVLDFPEATEEGQRFTLEAATIDGVALPQTAKFIVLTDDVEVSYGDLVKIYGKMLLGQSPANPGGFAYDAYLQDSGIDGTVSARYDGSCLVVGQGERSVLMSVALDCRQRFFAVIAGLPQTQQDILTGIFLGGTNGMSQGQIDVLSQSGVRHCFCVSGLHVGYLVLFGGWLLLLLKVARNRTVFFLVPLLLIYCAMTGFQPAVIRASVMCFVTLLSVLFGRQRDGLTALALAGYLLLLWNPGTLWHVGFQLSFGAMFGILYFTPFLKRVAARAFPGKTALMITLGAQMVMIPLVAYSFHIVSFISLFLNTLACLMAGGIVLLCFAGTILGSVLGSPLAAAAGFLSSLLMGGLEAAVKLPFASMYAGEIPFFVLALVLGALTILPKVGYLRYRPLASCLSVVCLLALLLFPFGSLGKQPLEVTFLSVGEKDCIYVSTPHGKDILIDAGGDQKDSAAVYNIRPFLLSRGVNTLDTIFVSHSDRDHAGSIPYLLDFFGVKQLVLTEASYYYTTALEEEAAEHAVEVVKVSAGDYSRIDGVDFEVLAPAANQDGDSNELSMVLRVSYGDFTVLFTGDAAAPSLEQLALEGVDLTAAVLKIPHHGSKTGYSEVFYEAVGPEQVVISVGENDFGHPDRRVTAYWQEKKIPCYRTDEAGAVTFLSEGKGYEVRTFLH